MKKYSESKVIQQKASLVNQIILDVSKYPEFLPWCSEASVLESYNDNSFKARMSVNFHGFKESYISRIVATQEQNDKYYIDVEAIDGPFKTLENKWQISKGESDNECVVHFSIAFEFKSTLLEIFASAFFTLATEKMIDAFVKRAESLAKK